MSANSANQLAFYLDLPNFIHPGESDPGAGESLAFRQSLKAISFVCDERINAPYRLEVVFEAVSDVKVDHDLLLAQVLMFRAEWKYAHDQFDPANAASGARSQASYADASGRTFTGRVSEVEFLGKGNVAIGDGSRRALYFRVVAVPSLWAMTVGKRNTAYVMQSVKQIVEKVFAKYNFVDTILPKIAHDFGDGVGRDALNGVREFALQYQESDYDFLLRWIERQGWHFLFDFSETEKVRPDARGLMPYGEESVFIDAGMPLRKLGFGSSQYLRSAYDASGLGIKKITGKFVGYPRQLIIHDHDPGDPAGVHPLGTKERPHGMPSRVLEGEFYSTTEEGQDILHRRLTAMAIHRSVYSGEANLPGFAPGRTFLLLEDALDYAEANGIANQDYSGAWGDGEHARLVIAARHTAVAPLAAGTAANIRRVMPDFAVAVAGDPADNDFTPGYRVRFDSIPFPKEYFPVRNAPWPKLTGNIPAWVLAVDPDDNPATACYADGSYTVYLDGVRPVPKKSLDEGSTFFVPRVDEAVTDSQSDYNALPAGTEVRVSFSGGNPDRPVISGVMANYAFRQQHIADGVRKVLNGGKTEFMSSDGDDGNIINYLVTQLGTLPTLVTAATNSSTMANVNAYTTSISGLALDSFSSVVAQNFAKYKNMIASSVDPSPANLINILNTLITTATKGGFTYYDSKLADDYRQLNNDSLSAKERQDLLDGIRKAKMGKGTLAGVMTGVGRSMSLVQALLLLFNVSDLASLRSRVTLMANENTSALITAAASPSKMNVALNISDIATSLVKDAVTYADAVAARVSYFQQVENEFKSREQAQADADKKMDELGIDHTAFDKKADAINDSMSHLTGVKIGGGVVTISQALLQVMIYLKLIVRAGRFNLGNAGVAIVSRRSPDAKKGVLGNMASGALSMVKPFNWSKIKLFFTGKSPMKKFENSEGMTINISSDGKTFVAGDDLLQLYSGANSGSPLSYNPNPISKQKATLTLMTNGNGGPAIGADISPAFVENGGKLTDLDDVKANSNAVLAAENVGLRALGKLSAGIAESDKVDASSKVGMTMTDQGALALQGIGGAAVDFDGGVSVSSKDKLHLQGKNVFVEAGADGCTIESPGPYIQVKGDKAVGDSLKSAYQELLNAKTEYSRLLDQYLASIKSSVPTTIVLIDTYSDAVDAQYKVVNAKQKAYDDAFKAASPEDSLKLAGDKDGKNTVILTPKDISVTADEKVRLGVTGGTEILLEKSSLTIDGKSKTVTVKGQQAHFL